MHSFGVFHFKYFPEHLDGLRTYASNNSERGGDRYVARLWVENEPSLEDRLIDCMTNTVAELFKSEGLSTHDVKAVLTPQISPGFIAKLSQALGFARETDRVRTICLSMAA